MLKLFKPPKVKYYSFRQFLVWAHGIVWIIWDWVAIILVMLGGGFEFEEDLPVIVFSIFTHLWFLYCLSYEFKKWLFKKYGKKYKAKMVKADMNFTTRGPNLFYIHIEFKRGKKKLIRRTAAYMGYPCKYLENADCSVYEFMGKFIEGDFNVRKQLPENGENGWQLETDNRKFPDITFNKYV